MKFEPLLTAAPLSGVRVTPFDGARKYLSTGDLQGDSLSFVDVTFKDKPSRADILVREGDVLFARMKGTRKVLRVTEELAGTIVSTGFAVLRPSEGCDQDYLATYLNTDYFERLKGKYCAGAIQPAITNGGIEKLKIPLPPLNDQTRIAHLLGKVEGLIAQRKQQLQQLNNLPKSVFLAMFGDPVRNEKGWIKLPLVDLTHFITDGKHGDCNNDEGSGYYFISAKDIHDGIIDYSKARQITEDEFKEVHRRTDLKANDLVMVNTGATIGKIAIAQSDPKTSRTTFQKSVAVIKPKHEKLKVVYLKALFEIRLRGLIKVSSGSAQQNLLLSQMRKIPVIVPPIELQSQFAEIVEIVESLKSGYQQSLADLETLYGALSQQAFKGELDLSRVPLPATSAEGVQSI